MNNYKEEELNFLKDRLDFRQKLFMEYAFADRRLISNFEQYRKDTIKVEDKIRKLKKILGDLINGKER